MIVRAALIAWVALICTGCSALNLKPPTATFAGMAVRDVTGEGFTMQFEVDLANPNAVELPLTGGDYKLAIAGVDLLDGKAAAAGPLPANGTRRVSLPVNVTYVRLIDAGSALSKGGGRVPYALEGNITAVPQSPLASALKIPLKTSGTLDLKQLLRDPTLLLRSPTAQRLSRMLLGL